MIRLLYILLITAVAVSAQWSYNNVEDWDPQCHSGEKQSPINLDESLAIDGKYEPLKFFSYNTMYMASMTNNGHTVKVTLNVEDKDAKPYVTGGNLLGKYIFDQMHFHWESEHTIDQRRYPLELHIVHYNSLYEDVNEATKHADGLLVLAVFYYLSPDDYENLFSIMEVLDNVGQADGTTSELTNQLALQNLLPCDTAGYYRYSGSLTTPGCNEAVTWIVFTNAVPISSTQEDKFKNIYTAQGILLKNYRPLQQLNNRRLMLRRSPMSDGSTTTVSSFMLLISLIFIKIF